MKLYQYLWVLFSFALILSLFTAPAQAESNEAEVKTNDFAIGYEVSFPLCYGLTFTYNIDKSMAIQGLVTMSPQPIMLSTVKVLYKLKQDNFQPRQSNTYIYALAGQFEDDGVWSYSKRVTGYSVGIGTEFTPKNYPENYKNYLEVGFINFNSSQYNPSLTVSAGIKVCY
jgi:hypothetical protein